MFPMISDDEVSRVLNAIANDPSAKTEILDRLYRKAYKAGHAAGFKAGDSEGYDRGYAAAWKEGYDVGIDEGRDEGQTSGYNLALEHQAERERAERAGWVTWDEDEIAREVEDLNSGVTMAEAVKREQDK